MNRFRFFRPILAVRHKFLRCLAVFAALLAAAVPPASSSSLPVFKLFIEAPGPYKVSFEDLVAAGLEGESLPSANLGVTNEGHPVPIWVEDGGDGAFGPGDWFELVGKQALGWVSYLDEFNRYNVYVLRFDGTDPLRMTAHRPAPKPPAEDGIHHTFRRRRHHERDFFIQRTLISHDNRPSELWYWAKMSQIDAEPLVHHLYLDDLSLETGAAVDLAIELRGWSRPAHKSDPEMADHRVELTLNGEQIAATEWNGTEIHRWTIPDIDAKRFAQGENALAFSVPKRAAGESGDPLIDVSMLNWIEVTYPRISEVGGGWADFELRDPLAPELMLVRTLPGVDFILYGENGSRMISDALPRWPEKGNFSIRVFDPPLGETSFIAVGTTLLGSPKAIVLDRTSRLRDRSNQADYIMIVHRRLFEALRPLADFHRSRGLAVEVVDVQDVYDEFSHSMVRPEALHGFLEHAYHQWQAPAPRFVLLAGDASWTAKDVYIGDGSFSDQFEQAPAPPTYSLEDIADELNFTPYEPAAGLVNRNLIPTWNQTTVFGHAANDNYFVAVAGDDDLPDMAIGRLTVVEPSEVTAIVDKTIRYASAPEVGPWRRHGVFLTNTLKRFHNQSRNVADAFTTAGYSVEEIYPELDEPDNAQYTRRLIELLNEGLLFVHYLGHGGRYIWETGRRDLKENRDLFTFEDLETLHPTQRLPVVLSLTCYSAPFDHPDADSLGERLLRIPDRGAIGVVAASWTNGPSGTWGQILLEELTRPGATVGEAFMRAKHRIPKPMFVNVYNLLGDPAVPVAQPAAEIELSVSGGDGRPLKVSGVVGAEKFTGELLVELIDRDRQTLRTVTSRVKKSKFAVDLEIAPEELAAASVARAYAWNASQGIDAAGVVALTASNGEPERQTPPRRRRRLAKEPVETAPPPVAASAGEIRAGTAAWWSFDETEGDVARDRLDVRHGTLVDRADRSWSPRGGALAFYEQGHLDFGSDGLDLGTGDFAIQAWMATRRARDRVWVILDKRAPAGYHLYIHYGRLGMQIAADGGFSNYTGPFIADGRWHHVVVSVDRDAGDGVRWFIDGVEAGERQDPTAHQGSLDNPSPLYVGGRRTGGGNFDGDLDEVAIFRRALSILDVENLYRQGWGFLAGAEPEP